ncbi:MAG: hypothetical protein ACYC6S_03600 [Desulfobulbia bacterium]
MKHIVAKVKLSIFLLVASVFISGCAELELFEGDPTSLEILTDLKPYTNLGSVCDKADSVAQRGRWLLREEVAIDLNNRLMFIRRPLGMTWDENKKMFSGSPEIYTIYPPGVGRQLNLPGWHATSMDEVRAMYTKCATGKNMYGRFNSIIFPLQNRGHYRDILTPTEGRNGRCEAAIDNREVLDLFVDETEKPEGPHEGGCWSGGETKGIVYPVRKLTSYEAEKYTSMFEEKIGPTKSKQNSYVSYISGDKLTGEFNDIGEGFGLMEYQDQRLFYGSISRHLPNGHGVFLDRQGNRFEGIAKFGDTQAMQRSSCQLNTAAFDTLIKSWGPFYWKTENARMKINSSWLGACKNGSAEGPGLVVTMVSAPKHDSAGKMCEVLLIGSTTMKNGVPSGEYTVAGRALNVPYLGRFSNYVLGKIDNGKLTKDYVAEKRDKDWKAVGSLLGRAANYMAKAVAEGAKSASTTSSTTSSSPPKANDKVYVCEFECRRKGGISQHSAGKMTAETYAKNRADAVSMMHKDNRAGEMCKKAGAEWLLDPVFGTAITCREK